MPLRVCSKLYVLVAAALLLGAGCGRRSGAMALDVPGRADATPSLAAAGSFVAAAWGATSGGKADVFVAVSRDGGDSFGAPVRVNAVDGEARLGGEFPPRVSVLAEEDSSVPEIVVLWTALGKNTEIKVARSRDGGRTFDASVALQSPGAAGDRGWPAVALDAQDAIHAIWLDHRGLAGSDGQAHTAHQPGVVHDGFAMAQKSGLHYASIAGEPTADRELATGVCYCCKTALAAGPDGAVFAAWRHVYPGDLRDMAFTVSRDGGRSFAPPVRVSEDRWAINGCPDDGPALAVDSGSTAHLVWPTVISDPAPQGALFYASTHDGRQFTSRVRIPTLGGVKPSHPQIAIDREGRIFVAWDESVFGQRVAAAREVKLQEGRAPEFGEIVRLSSRGSSTYPVLAATDRGLVAAWTSSGDESIVEVRTIRLP